MDLDAKRLLRLVLREVHPDRYTNHPEASSVNAEALKKLNAYVDTSKEDRTRVVVEFLVREGNPSGEEACEDLVRVKTLLESKGTLAPLFRSFGLISEEEASSWEEGPKDDRDLVVWLKEVVEDATRASLKHDQMREEVRRSCRKLERTLGLEELSIGGNEFSTHSGTLNKNMEILHLFEQIVQRLTTGIRSKFQGIRVCLRYPDSNLSQGESLCTVGSDGTLFLVVCEALFDYLQGFEGHKLLLASRMGDYWRGRVGDLTEEIRDVLQVDSVVVDHAWEPGTLGPQKFSMWARRVLTQRASFKANLQDRHIPITILVHDDFGSPLIDHATSSSVIQVRSDCAPERLLDFLLTTLTDELIQATNDAHLERKNMDAALDRVRDAFGARYVVSVLPNSDCSLVISACQKLLENSEMIRQNVELAGSSLCIDDSYDAWDNGFISIPYNFQTSDLQANLCKLLPPAKTLDRDTFKSTPTAFMRQVIPGRRALPYGRGSCCVCRSWQGRARAVHMPVQISRTIVRGRHGPKALQAVKAI